MNEINKVEKKELYIGPHLQYVQRSNLLYHTNPWLLLQARKHLILVNYQNQALFNIRVDQAVILFCEYHPTLEIFLLLTDNNQILTLSKDGQIIGKQRFSELNDVKFILLMQMKRSPQSFIPNYREDRIILITSQNCFMTTFGIKYQRGYLRTKNLVSVSIKIIGKLQMVLDAPEWIQNIKVFPTEKLLICWCHSETYIYNFPENVKDSLKVVQIYRKISRRDNKIMDFTISFRFRYLICAYQLGLIKIYKFDESRRYVQQLKGHIKQCTTLTISQRNDRLLYSAGLDNCIKVWDINQFSQVYSVRLDLIIQNIVLFSDVFAFAVDNYLKRSAIITMNLYLMEPIISENQADITSKLVHVSCNSKWVITLYSSNHIESFTYQEYPKRQKQMVQFPLQYGYLRNTAEIQQQLFAIGIQKGFSLLRLKAEDPVTLQKDRQNFELKKLVYNQSLQIEKDSPDKQRGKMLIEWLHQKLLGTYMFTVIHDWKMIPTAISVTCVGFIFNVDLPKWDCQTKWIEQKSNKKKIIQQINQEFKKFVILGTQQGIIYFIDIKQRQMFYTKVIFHSAAVSSIKTLKPLKKQNRFNNKVQIQSKKLKQLFFLSASKDSQICIWSLSHNRYPTLYHKVISNKQISCLEVFDEFILVGQKQGHLIIAQAKYYGKQFDPSTISNQIRFFKGNSIKNLINGSSSPNHMKSIICIDHLKLQGKLDIFLTGDLDSNVKIWVGTSKILVLDLKLFGILQSVGFLKDKHKLDMLVCQNNQISFLRTQTVPVLNNLYISLKKFIIENSKLETQEFQEIYFEQILAIQNQGSKNRQAQIGLKRLLSKHVRTYKNDIEYIKPEQQQNSMITQHKLQWKNKLDFNKKNQRLQKNERKGAQIWTQRENHSMDYASRYAGINENLQKSRSLLKSTRVRNSHFRISNKKEQTQGGSFSIIPKLPKIPQKSKFQADFQSYSANLFTDRKIKKVTDLLSDIASIQQIKQRSFSNAGRKKF